MNILILGASGFIGRNLVPQIPNEHKVLTFSRKTGHNLFDAEHSKYVIEEFNPDVIYNLASHGGSLHYVSEFAADVVNDNTQMYLNLYKIVSSLKNKPLIVNPISNCAYPGNTTIQKEAEWLNGATHPSVLSFANSKRMLFNISKCYEMQHGIKSANLIFPNAFGINDHTDPNKTHAMDGMIIRMLKAKRENTPTFEVWGTGEPIREWIYSNDFAEALRHVPLSPNYTFEPLNIAQGRGYKIKESVEIIKELSGYEGDIVFNTKYKDGDPIKILDDTKFRACFPMFQFTDHREAIMKTIKYYEAVL